MSLRKNKKAQVYPILVTIFTIIILTVAFVNISKTKDQNDSEGNRIYIGEKQSQVYASLQDADSMQLFVEQAAKLAAAESLQDISSSCYHRESFESVVDPQESECGKYIYAMWSNKESLCLPDCQKAFKTSFHKNLINHLNEYFKAVGFSTPQNYNVTLNISENFFKIFGKSYPVTSLNLLTLSQRLSIAKQSEYLSETETTLAKSADVEPPCEPKIWNKCDKTDDCGNTLSLGEYNACDLNKDEPCSKEAKCSDGVDNDCDGKPDMMDSDCEEQIPEKECEPDEEKQGESCDTGLKGPCKTGVELFVCDVNGFWPDIAECKQLTFKKNEICDNSDNDLDCDGSPAKNDDDCKECNPGEPKEGDKCEVPNVFGACKEGKEIFECGNDGKFPTTPTRCEQVVFAAEEKCDGSSNDLNCDGVSAKDDPACKDPCEGVVCPDKCDEADNDIKKHSGKCNEGECVYESESCKGFGCTEGVCNDDPCKDITCPDKCDEADYKLYEGKCEQGECNYKRESCGDNGCINGVCNDCEPGKTDLRDACDVAGKEGVCKKGVKEYICDADGKWPTTFECKQITPKSNELCTNGLDDDCDGKTDSEDEDCFDCDPQNFVPQKKDCEVAQAQGICVEGEQTKTCEANGEWSDWSGCTSKNQPVPEKCTNGLDDDCDGDCDFDSNAGCDHGDDNCRVGVTAISVSETRPCPGEQVTVICTSTQPNINSIKASIDGKPCNFMLWQGNDAKFSCTTKTSTGSQNVVCDIDTLKSYSSGTSKSTSINVGGVSCCNQYTDLGACGSDVSCEWCPKCQATYYTGANDRCVRKGTCQGMCTANQCGAACDDTINPCLPTDCNDYCSGGKLYKTTDKRNACTSSCSCTYNNCDTGTPVDCGTEECDANKHLTGSCNNPCQGPSSPTAGGSASCGTCTPSCSCESGWIDLNNNMNDGCEYSCSSKTTESCDNKDNDCDGQIDEGCDDDNDGYCDKSMSYSSSSACPKGGADCNDNDNQIYPGAPISDCTSQDKNCNAITDSDEEECKDPCEGITCDSKCVGSLKKFNGKCVEGKCEYDTETCAFGCENENVECKGDPCDDIECLDKCEDKVRMYEGGCEKGTCIYKRQSCGFGCQYAVCNDCEPGKTDVRDVVCDVQGADGICKKGKGIFVCGNDGKWPGTYSDCEQTEFGAVNEKSLCSNGLDDDCDGKTDSEDEDCFDCEPGTEDIRGACDVPNVFGVCKKGKEIFVCGNDGKWPSTLTECRQTTFKTNEICTNKLDDDCDGELPGQDKDCPGTYWNRCDKDDGKGNTKDTSPYNPCSLNSDQACEKETNCKDTIDNDCDGEPDCSDDDCKEIEECKPKPAAPTAFFSWPTDYSEKRLNSCFGLRPKKSGSVDHSGIDIRSFSANVLAPADGVIKRAGDPQKMKKAGHKVTGGEDCWGIVEIQHQHGIRSRFLHLHDVDVKVGDKVKRGQKIGVSGGTGTKNGKCMLDAYAKHIHMDVIYDGLDKDFNPESCKYGTPQQPVKCDAPEYEDYDCIDVSFLNADLKRDACLSKKCPGDSYIMCCNYDSIEKKVDSQTRKGDNPFELGFISAWEESGTDGTESIGYDTTGKTSYGKYQIASGVGTMDSFLSFLKTKNNDLYKKLSEAGEPNCEIECGANTSRTCLTSCDFADVWLEEAAGGSFGDLEHEFMKIDYDIGVAQLKGATGLDVNKKSDALQNVMWSTAVQHGPGKAAEIFEDQGASTDVDEESLIKKIYDYRPGFFGSSTPSVQQSVKERFVREKRVAIAFLEYEQVPEARRLGIDISKVPSECEARFYVPPKPYEVPKGTPADATQVTKPQSYAKKAGSNWNAISPLCFFDLTGVDLPLENNCYYPFNHEDLDEVCAEYNLPPEVYPGIGSTPDSNSESSAKPDSYTGNAVAFETQPLNQDVEDIDIDSLTGAAIVLRKIKIGNREVDLTPLGKYEFKTGFTVQVNKKIDDPLMPVTDWFTETWNKCDDDLAKCLDEQIDAFNDKPVEQAKFTIDFASELCEEKEIGFFYDLMEAFEDCFSNGMYGCACEFNLSKYYSYQDLFIKFDSDKASLWLRDEGTTRIKQAEYVFAHGDLELDETPYPYHELLLEFDEETNELKNSKLIGFEREDQNGIREGVSDLFNDYKTIQLTKKDADSKQSASFTNIPGDSVTKCLYKKDKFRLCAKPKEEFKETLFPVNFAIQFKDKPPEGLCDSDKIKVIPGNVKPDAMVGGIAELFGFDLASIFSSIPIPAFQFLGLSLSVLDIVNNIPGQQDANLNVAVKVDDEDVAGYKVYCNDVPVDLGQEFLGTNTADSFVVINERVNDKVSQLDTYVDNNPYSKYLRGIDCHVPVAEASGMIKNVPGVKGILEGETLTFTLRQCQGNIFLDKLLEKDYCITLVPVDKNGQEMSECAVTNCAKTNSILSLVLKKLIESQLSQITVIPLDIIPEELQPYISLPDTDDFTSAILGERDFDFSDFVNIDQAQSDLTGALGTMISDTIGREVTGLALVNSIDDLSDFGKQTVLNELSNSIKQEDAKLLFDAVVDGRDVTATAQRAAIEKGVDYVEDPKAKELLKEFLTEGDPKSIAFREMKSAFKEKYEGKINEKKEALEKAAKDKKGEVIKDTVIEKALEKDCIKSYNVNIDDALECLDDDEISEIFNDVLEGDFVDAQQALIEKGLDGIEDSKSKEILKKVVAQRDFRGVAQDLLMDELDKLPDSLKKEFVVDVLQGKDINVESILQSEIVKIIPDINVKYVTDLVKNGNVKALIENSLKSELEKQLNIFLTQDCVPVNKDGEEN